MGENPGLGLAGSLGPWRFGPREDRTPCHKIEHGIHFIKHEHKKLY
jgi:hypothetical protein